MILAKLNVSLIEKERIFQGKKGKYLDLVFMENRGDPDEYGNDGFIAHSMSKEEREAGKKGKILGNWKHLGQKPAGAEPKPAGAGKPSNVNTEDSDLPF